MVLYGDGDVSVLTYGVHDIKVQPGIDWLDSLPIRKEEYLMRNSKTPYTCALSMNKTKTLLSLSSVISHFCGLLSRIQCPNAQYNDVP